jgi:SAM-dependent methyltransferase
MRKHWIRVVCDEQSHHLIGGIKPESLDVLEISGNRWENNYGYKKYESLYYPDFDLQDTNNFSITYDLIIIEHVLEHLDRPYKAMRNVYRLLNPDGHVLIITPFLVKVHNAPQDCTRWTESGIKNFLMECGYNKNNIETGSWGNRSCIKSNFYGWTKYNPLLHTLKNEPDFPIVVWAFVKK